MELLAACYVPEAITEAAVTRYDIEQRCRDLGVAPEDLTSEIAARDDAHARLWAQWQCLIPAVRRIIYRSSPAALP